MNGAALAAGVQLLEMELDDFCDYVWWQTVKDADQKGLESFERWLWMPPVGEQATTGPWSPEAEQAAFENLRRMTGK